MKQLLLSKEMKRQAEFGGSLLQGKRKTARPFSKRKPMHITFKRSNSYGRLSLVAKQTAIVLLVNALAKKHGVKVYELSVNPDHVHFLLLSPAKKLFQKFLRECSAKIVGLMTRAKKGQRLVARFWQCRPWSRLVEWGRAFTAVRDYILRNRLESAGVVPYDREVATKKILTEWATDRL